MYMLFLPSNGSSRMRNVYKPDRLSLVVLTTDLYLAFSYGSRIGLKSPRYSLIYSIKQNKRVMSLFYFTHAESRPRPCFITVVRGSNKSMSAYMGRLFPFLCVFFKRALTLWVLVLVTSVWGWMTGKGVCLRENEKGGEIWVISVPS